MSEPTSMDSIRQSAVEKAWAAERERVLRGMGRRQWSVSQQAELINTGKVTGFEGSHILAVKDYPEYAGNPDNIQFLPTIAHFDGVHNRNFRKDTEEGLFDERTGKIIPNKEPGKIPEQPEVKLTDKYEYSEEQARYLKGLPDFDQSGQDRQDRSRESRYHVRYCRGKADHFGEPLSAEEKLYERDDKTHQSHDYETDQLNPFGPREEHEVRYEEPDMAPSGDYAYEPDDQAHDEYDYETDQLNPTGPQEEHETEYEEPDMAPSGDYAYEPDDQAHDEYDYDADELNPTGPREEHETEYEEPDMAPSENYAYEPDDQTHDSYDYEANELNPTGHQGEQASQGIEQEDGYQR